MLLSDYDSLHGEDQMLGPDYEKARAAYDAMKRKAMKWRERGCAQNTIGVLLVDENEATGRELSYSQLRAIQIGVMVPRKAGR